uniref:Hypothetical chloroplast protein 565 n=1 Tax=Pyropia perforata TaxID=182771 RepID=A0A023HRC7_PYRPE|nr:hypothetical chloroplast protein 565 [Neoporphyra perforata]AGQ17100.1 hypothetical chloroplast protein 565 [Neoporphyra perforata]AHB35058.1 hypothetical chloroplast protein 565 [Neoporphyra perforata]AHB35267.1 hypothetical chloroplast protein 565 [Neoporphyra perforata]AIA19429.1 hypothetical protein [Neoporphyra perforata]AIA19638.1 hypothetical protein [Neoporphyra perforata]
MLIADDLDKLLEILPNFVREPLKQHPNRNHLIEVVMDLGRRPEARFPDNPEYLSQRSISWQDLDYCVKKIGNFSGDNRAGIEKTLHRISSMRNREGSIIGLTCRVGRAVFGTISIIRDLLEQGDSILLLGKPGVGKTTAVREIARVLADEMEKRVVIIDTSNEIAGDGDIPHPAIGRARRMQVARPDLQHQVMIEAVENHMPEVIIIDEIGTELEALAARTIAERGVQLVGTAHGNHLESLIKNPTLADLIGGIQYVTLGDDEAKRRGTQKSILERKAAPAFQIAIEIHERNIWIVHDQVKETIDQILQGHQPFVQKRQIQANGRILIKCYPSQSLEVLPSNISSSRKSPNIQQVHPSLQYRELRDQPSNLNKLQNHDTSVLSTTVNASINISSTSLPLKINNQYLYVYSLSWQHIASVITSLDLPIILTKEIEKSDAILALKNQVKQSTKLRQIAKSKQIIIYTIQNSTVPQITRALRKILNIHTSSDLNWVELCKNKTFDEIQALQETKLAIEAIILNEKSIAQLIPRSAYIRKMQHNLVDNYQLRARSFGEEPHRKLRIYPE